MAKARYTEPKDLAKLRPIVDIPADQLAEKLKEYGFPPVPANAKGRAVWKDIMSACFTYRTSENPKTLDHLESLVWSGAIVPPPCPSPLPLAVQSTSASASSPLRVKAQTVRETTPQQYEFFYIASTWIIPHACPPPLSTEEKKPYDCYEFVGFDGWYENGPPVLAGGTKSICDDSLAKVFIQYDFHEEDFDTPHVQPGDLVSAILSIDDDYFRLFLVNRNTGEYTRIYRKIDYNFEGRTAEWILGRQKLNYADQGEALTTLPNFGATYYRNNYAEYRLLTSSQATYIPRPLTVDNAELIDMIDQGGEMISTAEKVGPNLLYIFAYNDEQVPESGKGSK